jgi:hypothetical protein
MVLVVVLPHPSGAAAEIYPTGPTTPDLIYRELWDYIAAVGKWREVGMIRPGKNTSGYGTEL